MHPADVADLVAEQVEDLRREIERYSDLQVEAIDLEHDVQLYLRFTKHERHLVNFAVGSSLVAPNSQQIHIGWQVPDLGAPRTVRSLILHMDCTGFDGQPPTAALLLPDRTELPDDQWPASQIAGGIIRGHPDYNRPFFCRRGLREYHTHPQHQDDPWDKHREGTTLSAIALDLLNDLQHRWLGTV